MTDYETAYRALREGLEALADDDAFFIVGSGANEVRAKWMQDRFRDRLAALAPSPAEGTGQPDWQAIGQQIKDAGDESDRQRYAAWLADPQRFGTFPRVRERAFLAGFDAGRSAAPSPAEGTSETGEPVIPGYTLAELDRLHSHVGLGAEWQASDRRAELAAPVVTPSTEGGE